MSATISVSTPIRSRAAYPVRPAHVRPAHVRPAQVRSAQRTSRRVTEATYRRRRAVVGTLLAVFLAAGAVLTHDVLAGSSGEPASAAASQPALGRTTITAQPGDTLWSIGEAYHGSVPLSRFVDKLVDINGGASIQAGQAVLLP